jgi:mycothiol system anti-sigma-R factor
VSCGRPHEIDCRDVLDRMYEYLDAELTPRDLGKIREHLDECGPCLQKFDLEDAFKALIRRSCQDHAPASLRTRIMMRITQIRVEME